MTGLGLPTLKACLPVANSNIATKAPQPARYLPLPTGQLGLQHDCPPFANDHVIRMVINDGITDIVELREQSPLADDIGSAVLLARGQVAGRGHCTGENVFVVHVEAHLA